MTLTEAKQIAGSLSNPRKMPGKSYGLPAKECNVGGKLAKKPNTICSICYARKGMYVFPVVQNAQYRRYESLGHPQWVEAMVSLIRRSRTPYFRWHDSGDLVNLRHLLNIVEVCSRIPHMRFWLPTKEYGLLRRFFKEGYTVPDNLIIRVSAPMLEGLPPAEFSHGSTTYTDNPIGHGCPAPSQDGRCGDCRACWDPNVKLVSYRRH